MAGPSLTGASQRLVDGVPDGELEHVIAQLTSRLQRSSRSSGKLDASGSSFGSGLGNGDLGATTTNLPGVEGGGGQERSPPPRSLQHRRTAYTKPAAALPNHDRSIRGAIQFGIAGGLILGGGVTRAGILKKVGDLSPWTVATLAFFVAFLIGFVICGAISYSCLREDDEVSPKARSALEIFTTVGMFCGVLYPLLVCIEQGVKGDSVDNSLFKWSQNLYNYLFITTPISFAVLCWNNINWVSYFPPRFLPLVF